MPDILPPDAAPWRSEARALIALALPLIAGNIGWSLISATDLLLLGRVGADAVGAGALALNLYHACLVFGMGLTTAAAPMIAAERGRRLHSVRDIRRTVRQTLWAAVAISLPAWVLLWHAEALLLAMGQDPALAADAARLMHGMQWALLPYLGFLVLRTYVSALERPLWGLWITLIAIPVNGVLGWALIFGHLGLPRLGLFGAGLASSGSSLFMFLGLTLVIVRHRHFRRYHLFGHFWRADWQRFRAVWRIGLPIAVTLGLEVTVFNAAAFLMGLIDRPSLAAHAIALQISALSFMVPLGIGQAATVRVGFAFGRRDAVAVGRAGWLALAIGTGFALCAGTVLILFPRPLIGAFLDLGDPGNAQVVALAVMFLGVAALFQLVDCTQAIAAGALRGLQDTRVPMLIAAFGYWVVGIGIGTGLAFVLDWRGIGIWWGLASGLGVVSLLLTWRWAWRGRLTLFPQ